MLGVYPNSFQVYVLIARLNKPIDQLAYTSLCFYIYSTIIAFKYFPSKPLDLAAVVRFILLTCNVDKVMLNKRLPT